MKIIELPKKTEAEVERAVLDVKAIMAIENMDLDEKQIQRMRRILRREITIDEAIEEIVKELNEE